MPACTTCGDDFTPRSGPGRPFEKCPRCRRYRGATVPPPVDELIPPAGVMTVTDAARHGTHQDLLAALRWRLEQAFFDRHTAPGALPGLSRVLAQVADAQAVAPAPSLHLVPKQ